MYLYIELRHDHTPDQIKDIYYSQYPPSKEKLELNTLKVFNNINGVFTEMLIKDNKICFIELPEK